MSDEAARAGNQHLGLISHGSRLSTPALLGLRDPPKWDRDRLTTRMPRRMLAYNTQARRRSPHNITLITGYLVENRTHAMLCPLVRPSLTPGRRPKNGRRVDSGGRAQRTDSRLRAHDKDY